jgi:hypothetical protein
MNCLRSGRAKTVEGALRARGGHFIDAAFESGSALLRGAVEIAVAGQNQWSVGVAAGAGDRGVCAAGGERVNVALEADIATLHGAVKVSVEALHQSRRWVGLLEVLQNGEGLRGCVDRKCKAHPKQQARCLGETKLFHAVSSPAVRRRVNRSLIDYGSRT